ncbi:hypothetical protein [Clostridium sp. LCP25S3_F8]|uniref:hypothetical protein n=1 Tax=Clostridium sp. LCP25S3_F8 TaxID=3438751 RepID=UPI003F8E23BD
MPKPSSVFMKIQHYRKIYKVIKDWFESGNYDLSNEKMILTFPLASQIYEYYILFRINNYITENGYDLRNSKNFLYGLKTNAKYENTKFNNTFIFQKEKTTITVYYQPVIFLNQVVNDIGLFRNNNISINNEKSYYYTPDYIIKICEQNKSKFIILDAKWSTINSVINYSFKNIVYKYIFSISTINSEDKIDKVWVVNGKDLNNQNEYMYNYYNSKFKSRCDEIEPSAKIMTLNPNIDESVQKENLNKLFSIIIK